MKWNNAIILVFAFGAASPHVGDPLWVDLFGMLIAVLILRNFYDEPEQKP